MCFFPGRYVFKCLEDVESACHSQFCQEFFPMSDSDDNDQLTKSERWKMPNTLTRFEKKTFGSHAEFYA